MTIILKTEGCGFTYGLLQKPEIILFFRSSDGELVLEQMEAKKKKLFGREMDIWQVLACILFLVYVSDIEQIQSQLFGIIFQFNIKQYLTLKITKS